MEISVKQIKSKAAELRKEGGMQAVDLYLDKNHKIIPWEYCYDCDTITPRDITSPHLYCFFKEDHEQ